MNNNRVLFISQLGGDAQAWAYGLGRRGIYTATATLSDVHNNNLALDDCALIVVELDDTLEKMISLCRYLRTIFDGPILLFTYEGDERFQLDVYHVGIDGCIIKPIGIPLALAKLMSWLRADYLSNDTHSFGQPYNNK